MATSAITNEPIVDSAQLKRLDGLVHSGDKCSNYFDGDPDFEEIGVQGGELQLAFDADAGRLLVVTEYASPRKLNPKELKALVDETAGQWSDGIGEGIGDEWRESHGVCIDFAPLDRGEPKVEQIDDGVAVKAPRKSPLLSAAEKGDLAKVERLLDKGELIDARDKNGMTPLHHAILSDHVDVALFLLERGADRDARDKEGSTAITFACMRQLQPVVGALLDRGCDVNTRDARGATPLMWAANRGSMPLVVLLVERGADVNAQDTMECNEGHTPLMYVQGRSLDIARYLLERGADPKLRTKAGETASQIAARNTHQSGWRDLVALYQAAEEHK